jgi:ABC-2 type transport system permease protein
MNIFIREMKAHRKSLIIWCIAIVFTVISGMAKFTTASSSGVSYNKLMSQMPQSLRALLQVGSFDLSKVSGYYGMLFVYILLMAAIHASMLGANIISKEERDKTVEFLMAKPVSRSKIVTAKLSAAIVNIVIFNLVSLGSSIAVTTNYNSKGEPIERYIIMLMTGMFIIQILFLSMGTAIAAKSKNPKAAGTISTIILLATYLLSVIIDINSKLEGLKILTPFKYFNSYNLMYGKGFSAVYIILSIILIIGFSALTYVFYEKRDLGI